MELLSIYCKRAWLHVATNWKRQGKKNSNDIHKTLILFNTTNWLNTIFFDKLIKYPYCMEIVIVFRSIFPMNNFEKIKNKKQKLKCTSNAL